MESHKLSHFDYTQAYAGAPNSDNKESITWARFEYADVNNSAFYPDYIEGSATPPLLLVLGYTTGVQVRKSTDTVYKGNIDSCYFTHTSAIPAKE